MASWAARLGRRMLSSGRVALTAEKTSTGVVGLDVVPNAPAVLAVQLQSTLTMLKDSGIPETAVN